MLLARFTGDDLEDPRSEKITIELPLLEEDTTLGDAEAPTEIP